MSTHTKTFLNPQQQVAATFGSGPLLIIAGAGTGKTKTLAHRVAHLISTGVSPGRILLLTFTRRAAAELAKRVEGILSAQGSGVASAAAGQVWGGTFHAVAVRLLRMYGQFVGLPDGFTVIDRGDAEDQMDEIRSQLGFDGGEVRFPLKGDCLAVYSRCINAQEPVEQTLKMHFPWVTASPEQLKSLFNGYMERKQRQGTLDYDDLLLYWSHLMDEPALAAEVRGRFDAVLVDEYQDTNVLQALILKRLCPDGQGLTVVGDDAQSIYSFRAATVHNILDFPKTFPNATVLKLEQNYRSVQPILDATNAVIAHSRHRYNKNLFSTRASEQKPMLLGLADEQAQAEYVARRCLEHREAAIPFKKQAVLFRSAHHSDALEVELMRRKIPFVKYGGQKFLEAGHIKDVMAFLRLAENPKDAISARRVLQLLDGFGPARSREAIAELAAGWHDFKVWRHFCPPHATSPHWPAFVELMEKLAANRLPLAEQIAEVRRFYAPILDRRYEQAYARLRDLDQLEQLAAGFESRGVMLTDLTLDPPAVTQALARPTEKDEDCLVLSTIHSAKGCEWDCVYVLNAVDGEIPSSYADSDEAIEEERRLFYVALTRAKDFLDVCFPMRSYRGCARLSDRHIIAQLTRFLPPDVLQHFERTRLERQNALPRAAMAIMPNVDISKKLKSMFN